MKNSITLYGKYLVQFERIVSKSKSLKRGVYYRAYLYNKIEKVNGTTPVRIISVANTDSFNSKVIKNKMDIYGEHLIRTMLYTCKLLYMTENDPYINKLIPIIEVNPKYYGSLDSGQRRQLGINVSKIIKCLYYDEFEWDTHFSNLHKATFTRYRRIGINVTK